MRPVSQSVNIDTPNHTRPSVMTANGNVRSFSTGLSTVFKTPKIAAAASSWPVVPESMSANSQATMASTMAFCEPRNTQLREGAHRLLHRRRLVRGVRFAATSRRGCFGRELADRLPPQRLRCPRSRGLEDQVVTLIG